MAADEKSGYTLTDRGTYIALVANRKISLKIQGSIGERSHNPYSVIAVNPMRHPHVKFGLAVKYIDFSHLLKDKESSVIFAYGKTTLLSKREENILMNFPRG